MPAAGTTSIPALHPDLEKNRTMPYQDKRQSGWLDDQATHPHGFVLHALDLDSHASFKNNSASTCASRLRGHEPDPQLRTRQLTSKRVFGKAEQ